MLKNNGIAILTQAACFIVFYIVAYFLREFIIGAGILSIFMWCVYIFIGTKLTPQNSIIKNLFSVSFIGILGFIVWILGFWEITTSWNLRQLIAVFIVPNIGILALLPKHFLNEYITGNLLVQIISTWIPTILMWIGLQWKEKKLKR